MDPGRSGGSVVPIVYTALGWVLGFLGTLGLQWLNRSKRKKDFELGLCVELKEAMSLDLLLRIGS